MRQQQCRRRVDAAQQVVDLRFGQPHGAGVGQSRVAAPAPAAFGFDQATFDDRPRQFSRQAADHAARAGGLLDAAKYPQWFAVVATWRERVPEALQGMRTIVAERAEPFDKKQSFDPFGRCGGDQGGDAGTQRMTEQGVALQLHGIDGGEHGLHVVEIAIAGAGGQMIGVAMAGQLQGDHPEACGKQGC